MSMSLRLLPLLVSALLLGCSQAPPAKVETPSAIPKTDKDGKVLPLDPKIGDEKPAEKK